MFLCRIKQVKIILGTIPEIVSYIDNLISEKNLYYPAQIVTLNLLMYLQSKYDKETYLALKNAKLVVPDSAGIVFCIFLFTGKLYKRIPGIELIYEICKLANKKKYKIYLLGSEEKIVTKTKKVLEETYQVTIVGTHSGYFDFSCSENVIKEINSTLPDILFVGLPTEIQEKWIYKNLKKLNTKIVVGIGGSFDVISGKLSRAPKIFLILGLEWLYRTLQEPWRIKRIIKLPLALTLAIVDTIKSFSEKHCVRS